jgi:hypothetical protein
MKTKKFAKKLTLKKETIVDLGNEQLGNVKGGDMSGSDPAICQWHDTCQPTCVTCVTCYYSCPNPKGCAVPAEPTYLCTEDTC